MRSDPRYLAVIPHHDGDDDNLPTPVQRPRLFPLSLALPLEALRSFLFLLLFLSRSFLSSLPPRRVFRLSPPSHISSLLSHAVTLPRVVSLRLSLTRKLADPISNKTALRVPARGCIYLRRVETVRCPLLSLLPLDAPAILSPHVAARLPRLPFTFRKREKICRFDHRVSRLRLNDERGWK